MSMFYCEHHGRVEDSDFVGFVIFDGQHYCDEGAAEVEYLQELEDFAGPLDMAK